MKKYIILIVVCVVYIVGLFMSFPYLLEQFSMGEGISTIRNIFEYSLMFSSLLVFCAVMMKNRFTQVISYILLLVLSLNFMVSASCFFIYKSGFNIGMAVSVLDTNIEEATSMSRMLVIPLVLSVLYFLLQVFASKKVSEINFKKSYLLYVFASLWFLMPFGFYIKHKYVKNKGGGKLIKNVYYHLSNFQGAFDLRKDLERIGRINPQFEIVKEKEGVENIILVIGESARRKSMSLYGYNKKTTPFEDKERENMLIFSNAVSSAGITNLSVPLMLSLIEPNEMKTNYSKIAYNIVNFGNKVNYDTYWLSTQGGAKSITAIASRAKNRKWVNGYDEVIVSHLKEVMSKKGKKLIILHINGSHPDPCTRYPKEMDASGMDCYDTSILYTDKIMHEIFKILKPTESVLLYTSDHAVKISAGKYLHTDSKESTEVPLYIWYGDKISPNYKQTGYNDAFVNNTIIYPLIVDFMGYKKPEPHKSTTKKYLNLEMKEIDYDELKD